MSGSKLRADLTRIITFIIRGKLGSLVSPSRPASPSFQPFQTNRLQDGKIQMDRSRWSDPDGQIQMVRSRWSDPDGQIQRDRSRWSDPDGQMQMDRSRMRAS
eukprot:1393224-Amorphochlora_amoeboformis.AAC.1